MHYIFDKSSGVICALSHIFKNQGFSSSSTVDETSKSPNKYQLLRYLRFDINGETMAPKVCLDHRGKLSVHSI